MKINKELTISDKQGNSFVAYLNGKTNQGVATILLNAKELDLEELSGNDFFECLTKLRQILESKDLYVLCQGSVRNVYPSRMSSQMSGGLKAYILKLGMQASLTDLVNIFDSALIGEVATVNEQKIFYKKWIESLNK
ncbi:hypothetical protein [Pedobacter lusitanus]|uniref:hypothetical protein n=1 Tax=Pedobacter lusitanus TaxID=1503925 RepID=UPI00069891DB|nr:hypothetical protein [Pedobacter lusitanus]